MYSWRMDNRTGNEEFSFRIAEHFGFRKLPRKNTRPNAEFQDEDGYTYELKCDKQMLRNGNENFFAEFQETANDWATSRVSGIKKQAEFTDFFLIVVKRDGVYGLLKIPSERMLQVMEAPHYKTVMTGYAACGNNGSRYAKGKLIHMKSFMECKFYPLPADLDPLDEQYNPRKIPKKLKLKK
jgi:hypothetical protein